MPLPKKIFTQNEKNLIIGFVELGKTDKEIANIMKMPRTTYLYAIKSNGMVDMIKRAKGISNSKVEMALYSKALSGNVLAQIFWLCNRKPNEWRNVQHVEQKIQEIPKITFVDVINLQNSINETKPMEISHDKSKE
jgi:hypothetical protein